MSLFKRIAKIFQAEAHSALDKLEDPIKMTEQGIRDMKKDLEKAIHALAEVKAMAIRAKNEANNYKARAEEYHQKAVQLLQLAQQGKLNQVEAERLAGEALKEKNFALQKYQEALRMYEEYQAQMLKLEKTVTDLRNNIRKWETELRILKARASVAKVTKKVNKELSQIDSSGTIAMLEKMKEKIAKEEALAEAYSEITPKSIDEQIEEALSSAVDLSVQNELEALKAQISGELPSSEAKKQLPEADQIKQELEALKQQSQQGQQQQ